VPELARDGQAARGVRRRRPERAEAHLSSALNACMNASSPGLEAQSELAGSVQVHQAHGKTLLHRPEGAP